MLSAAFIEKLEYVARHVRNQPHLPWGGLQLILVGDFFQLPPIDGSFCFESRAWKSFITKHIELKTVYRQTDPQYKRHSMFFATSDSHTLSALDSLLF